MDAKARNALRTIRRCIDAGRFTMIPHFRKQMAKRGLVWPDVQAAIDEPAMVKADGADDWGRARWLIAGDAADGQPIEIVCVLDRNAAGEQTVFITLYWKG